MIAPTSKEHGPTGLLLCLLIFLCIPGHLLAQTWLDAAWEYRKVVSVDNSANTSALADYSVRVDLGAAFDFTHAQAGGEDVRFTAADGTTLLDYWIEFWDSVGDSAIVWVEVPAVPALSSIDVYMYYGNLAAADAANGDSTFLFFDDFEDPALNSKWASWDRVVIDSNLDGSHNIGADDVDGDGKPDLVVTSYRGENLAWYQQPADLVNDTWTRFVIDPLLENAHDMQIADIDGDLRNDVIGLSLSADYTNYGLAPGYLCWYKKPADPTTSGPWQKTVIASSGDGGLLGSRSCGFDDIDGDGDLDIAVSVDRSGGHLVWYENPGGVVEDSTWNEYSIDNGQGNGADVQFGDFDGDGNLDMVYAGHGTSVYLYFAPADPTDIPGWTRVTLTGRAYHVHVVDFDGDGDADILRAGGSAHLVSWLENPRFGPSPADPRVPANWNEYIIENSLSINVANHVQAADVDSDGDLDIGMNADPGGSSGTFRWYRRPTDPTDVGAWQTYIIDDNPVYTAWAHDSYMADMDLDGMIDMVGVGTNAKTVMLWLNDTTTTSPSSGLDPAKWTDGGVTVTGGLLTINTPSAFARSIPRFQYKAMRTKARFATLVQYGAIGFIDGGTSVGTNDAMFSMGWTPPFLYTRAISSGDPGSNFEFGPDVLEGTDFKTWEIKRQSAAQVDFEVNDTLRLSAVTPINISDDSLFAQINTHTGAPEIESDWVLVRNYTSPEPGSTPGSEETKDPPIPTLALPLDLAVTDSTPSFVWSATAGPGGTYTLEYSQVSDFSTGVVTQAGLVDTSFSVLPGAALADGIWFWHVQAIDITLAPSGYQAVPYSFTVDTEAPDVPTLIGPPDAAVLPDSTPMFLWSDVAGTGGLYTLQYAPTSDFSSGLVAVANLVDTTFTVADVDALPDGIWYWRVQAADPVGNASGYQLTPFSLTMLARAPAIPELLIPTDNALVNQNPPTMIWSSTSGPGGTYTLEYALDSVFVTSATVPGLVDTLYTIPVALANGRYFWHVKAISPFLLESDYQSEPFAFNLDAGLPTFPLPQLPPKGSFTSDRTPTFVWIGSTDPAGRASSAAAVTYTIQYSADSTFGVATEVLGVADTVYTVPDSAEIDYARCFWRVEAVDSSGNQSGFSGLPCVVGLFNAGDVELNGTVSSSDLIVLVNYVFKGGPPPLPCIAAGDVNCTASVTSADIIYLVGFIFKNGPEPCEIGDLIMGGTWDCP